MPELRECPFCGGKGKHRDEPENGDFLSCDAIWLDDYGCPKCRIWFKTADAWNRRPADDALRARIVELEKELAETEGYPGIAADMLKLKAENSRLVRDNQFLTESLILVQNPTGPAARLIREKRQALTAAGEEGERDA